MAISRISLFLFIIRFALAVPVVAREVHEVRVNVVDVAGGGTVTSQNRWDSGPRDDWLVNTANQAIAPTTPRLSDLDDSELHSTKTSTRSNDALLSSTRPHARAKDDPASPGPADNSQPSIPASDNPASSSSPSTEQPDPLRSASSSTSTDNSDHSSTEYEPLTSGDEVSSSDSQGPIEPETKNLVGQLSSKPSPFPETEPLHVAEPGPLYLAEPGPSHPSESGPSHPAEPGPSHPTEPEPSNPTEPEPSSPTQPETQDFLSKLDSGSPQPGPVEPEAKEFLYFFLKNKFERRISYPGVVDSVQESQAAMDSRSYVFASSSPAAL